MIFKLVLRGLKSGRARFACAVAGIAIATGTLVFMTSFVATNDAQAPAAARRACVPWAGWKVEGITLAAGRRGRPMPPPGKELGKGGRPPDGPMRAMRGEPPKRPPRPDPNATLSLRAVQTTIDYRPGGHVLQGPPMRAFIAAAPAENPYGAVRLAEGRWVDERSGEPEIVCVRTAMRRFGRMNPPQLGEDLKFVGESCTMTAKIVGFLDGEKLPAEFPFVFANRRAFDGLGSERMGLVSLYAKLPPRPDGAKGAAGGILTPESESVKSAFKADVQRHLDYARPLLLIAAVLTALSLLVNSLLLSVESNRGMLATLRVVGLTRFGIAGFVFAESLFAGIVGWALGVFGSFGALAAYVAADPAAFPAGVAFDFTRVWQTAVVMPAIVLLASLFALAPALRVRAMDAAVRRPRTRRRGMAITFGLGFAAFVAVEVWGASLMRGFVPSVEWPDAIVSLLPNGVSSWDVEKLRTIPGVKRISELVPRQCFLAGEAKPSAGPRPRMRPNALFMAAEWLPKFKFVEGDWASCDKALRGGDSVVISLMMSRAHNLHVGDRLVVMQGGRRGGPPRELSFPIAGVVDLNWHMVTSRGLVRGLNGSPGMTDGPVFCSLDTMGIIDPRTYMTEPSMSAPMTHLWVEYEKEYLERHGVFKAGRLIEAEIAKRLGNPIGATVRLHARDEIADGTLAHGTDVIGQTARVPFVFLAILSIGFVAMLVAEAEARKREFAVLRAVGATQAQLAWRLVASAVNTALIGIVIGLPLGAFAGWFTAIGTANMWPGMPHYLVVPAPVIIEGAIGALVFAMIFAVPTALSIIRRTMRRR